MDEVSSVVRIENLSKFFLTGNAFLQKNKQKVRAVEDVSMHIKRGETLGLVGESGCGKSTLGKCILRLTEPTKGSIYFEDKDLMTLSDSEMRQMRRKLQIVFQDPYSAINPRMTVLETVCAPLNAFNIGTGAEREKKAMRLIEYVGLSPSQVHRYPHEFSGGQRQRIIIARALILDPVFIVCDEPVSALDVSIRSQVLNLMQDIQKERELTYLFISHDLSVIKHISDRIAVMYLGRLVELADKEQLFENPIHPYTRALMEAIPIPDPERSKKHSILVGDVPSPINPPSGCRFHTRCPYAMDICSQQEPTLVTYKPDHQVACHRAGKIDWRLS